VADPTLDLRPARRQQSRQRPNLRAQDVHQRTGQVGPRRRHCLLPARQPRRRNLRPIQRVPMAQEPQHALRLQRQLHRRRHQPQLRLPVEFQKILRPGRVARVIVAQQRSLLRHGCGLGIRDQEPRLRVRQLSRGPLVHGYPQCDGRYLVQLGRRRRPDDQHQHELLEQRVRREARTGRR
jgi:hypothetical protein